MQSGRKLSRRLVKWARWRDWGGQRVFRTSNCRSSVCLGMDDLGGNKIPTSSFASTYYYYYTLWGRMRERLSVCLFVCLAGVVLWLRGTDDEVDSCFMSFWLGPSVASWDRALKLGRINSMRRWRKEENHLTWSGRKIIIQNECLIFMISFNE